MGDAWQLLVEQERKVDAWWALCGWHACENFFHSPNGKISTLYTIKGKERLGQDITHPCLSSDIIPVDSHSRFLGSIPKRSRQLGVLFG